MQRRLQWEEKEVDAAAYEPVGEGVSFPTTTGER